MTPTQAREALDRIGAQGEDFFALPMSTLARILEEADAVKYRKPWNANGSRARHFYAHLTRTAARKER